MTISSFCLAVLLQNLCATAVANKQVASASAPAPLPQPEALLRRVQRAYAKGGDFEADFTQTHLDLLSGHSRTASGHMWVKADGRVRFAYLQPEVKDFVFDGDAAYFYEPENAQVTVFDHFADSPVAQAMQFLWGVGSLKQLFTVSACPPQTQAEGKCPKAQPGEQVVHLQPRKPLPTVEHVALGIDPRAAQVRRSVVYDALHNETCYTFERVHFTALSAAERFVFTMPPGVSVLRAPPLATAVPNPSSQPKLAIEEP